MAQVNSPLNSQNSNSHDLQSRRKALQQFKLLSLQFLKRAKGFIEAQKLPYIANKTCEVYLGKADKTWQVRCRRVLRTRIELDPMQLHHFFQTSLGDRLLVWFEQFVQLPGTAKRSLKDLLLEMANDAEGLSLLSFYRRIPNNFQINLRQLLFTAEQVKALFDATQKVVTVIRELSIQEAQHEISPDFSGLADIRQPGPFEVQQFSQTFDDQETSDRPYPLTAICYQPCPWPEGSVPVVVQSHGLASCPEDLEDYARHLASYGYFVVAPYHAGSHAEHARTMLTGHTAEVFQPSEFMNRPRCISQLLDALERCNVEQFEGKLNLEAVGLMGHSFGTYTAFALAGASLDLNTLTPTCQAIAGQLNLSLLLQCEALNVTQLEADLGDQRVQAIVCVDSVGSQLFGNHGVGAIQVPVLLIAGNEDTAAPLILEQVQLFQHLTTPHHYLALIQGKSHVQDWQQLVKNLNLHLEMQPPLPMPSETKPFDDYMKALSLAFLKQHLAPGSPSIPPLSAQYATSISHEPFPIWLVSQKLSANLKRALHDLKLNVEIRSQPEEV